MDLSRTYSGSASWIGRGNILRGSRYEQNNNDDSDEDDDEKVQRPLNNEEILSEIVIKINDDIRKIASSTEESNKTTAPKSTSLFRCTIHKVPKKWRKVHKAAFEPNLVTIGPFQRCTYALKDMDKLKLRFLSDLLGSKRTKTTNISTADHSLLAINEEPSSTSPANVANNNPAVEFLALEIKELEGEARRCYSETFNYIDSQEFVLMMIRDSCFIIQLFRLFANCYKVADDPIFCTRWLVPYLRRDLLMFEYQIPWIVLEKVFEISGLEKEGYSLIDLALNFCNPYYQDGRQLWINANSIENLIICLESSQSKEENKSSVSLRHNVDEQQPQLELEISESEQQRAEEEPRFIHCVAELKKAGVKFIKRKNHDLLDIEFKNGVLEIPPLLIDDQTGLLFLNFLACEQCDGSLKPYFTHYVSFFDSLVNSAKDVEILHHEGIISHSLGSDEEVAKLFNELCKEIIHEIDDTNYLYEKQKEINIYCGRKLNKWRAELKHVYFKSPWTIFSVIAAIILLILTSLQTVFTIIPFALSS